MTMHEDLENDQRLFLRAFAEPTDTYRFLQTHRSQNPTLFLNRNLTYVKYKKCRPKKPKRRSSVKVNSLLATIEKLAEKKRGTTHYMTLTFSGFFCEEIKNERFAEVQIMHKESKAILTSIIIDINPTDMMKGIQVISLPTDALKITSSDGKLLQVSSSSISFRVWPIRNSSNCDDQSRFNRNCIFEAALELFDGNRNGLITSGAQQLKADQIFDLTSETQTPNRKSKLFQKKSLSLPALSKNGESEEYVAKPATLRFHLQWSKEIFPENEDKENGVGINGTSNIANRRVYTRSRSTGSIIGRRSVSTSKLGDTLLCLVYQFIHKNYRQKTEVWDRLKCPWCSLRAMNLYILLKHLTLCHDRFKFKYVPCANETRIDVLVRAKVEDLKKDPFSRLSTRFRGHEPHKRKTHTALLVFHPQRRRPRLSEFLRSFDSDLNDKKRTYYHSVNGLAMRSIEIDHNSEDELDPVWLRKNTVRMIDEFIDVNAGEKEIMKLWNLHVLRNNYVCDAQMPNATLSFVQTYAEEIFTKNIYRNCVVHISNLFDYNLISARIHFEAIKVLQGFLVRKKSLQDIVMERAKQQYEYARQQRQIKTMGKKVIRPSRKSNNNCSKKRLRSQSISDNALPRRKSKRLEPFKNTRKSFAVNSQRAARKNAKIKH